MRRGLLWFQRRRENKKAAYGNTFASSDGERVLRDLFRYCGMSSSGFDGNPFSLAHNEGMRRVFLYIQAQMELSTDDIMKLAERDLEEFVEGLDEEEES